MKEYKREFKCKLAIEKGFRYINGFIITPTGKIANKITKNGYILLTIRDNSNVFYLYAHQLVWYIHYNEVVDCIDHINNDKTNNNINNLRSVSKRINAYNSKNSKGYYLCKRTKKYISIITLNGKPKWLGSFNTKKEAKQYYDNFKNNLINELTR